MPVAEIITIGTELLLGEIQDTNTGYLARALRDAGVDLYRTMTVGDNINRIAQAIQESLERADIIITTGGLGPTVDDPTRQAIAKALGVELVFHPELWDQIQNRFQRYGRLATDNNRRQAFIPAGSLAVENPVGTAPAFICEPGQKAIISLPGVPREMEHLFNSVILGYLRRRYDLQGTIKATILHTASMGESQIDELIGDLEELTNPTVGLLAHPGQIDIRVAAKAPSGEAADRMISGVAAEIYKRLGENIFGADTQTLEEMIRQLLAKTGIRLVTVESGLKGALNRRLDASTQNYLGGEVIPEHLEPPELEERAKAFRSARQADIALAAALYPGDDRQNLLVYIITPEASQTIQRSWGGPPLMAADWGANLSFDCLRRALQPPVKDQV